MKTDVLGVQINCDPKQQILADIENRIHQGQKTFIVTPYSESLVAAQKDLEFRRVLNSADISLPDGIGVQWAAHFLGAGKKKIENRISKIPKLIFSLLSIIFKPKSIRDPIPERVPGSEFIWDLVRIAVLNDYSIFLLGGFADTPRVAAEKLKSKFPKLKIAGIASPNTTDGDELLRFVNNTSADFLFVALGPIRQEKWIFQNFPNLRVKLAIGLGGTLDYLAGNRPPAPQIWAKTGLEWLWRLITQPWRIGRIFRGILGLIWYTIRQ